MFRCRDFFVFAFGFEAGLFSTGAPIKSRLTFILVVAAQRGMKENESV